MTGGRHYVATRVVTAAVIGGTASELSGGKFANGALTAAFSSAFASAVSHQGSGGSGFPASVLTEARLAMKTYVPGFTGVDGYSMIGQPYTDTNGLRAILFGMGSDHILSFAGTDPSSWANWKANLRQAFGFISAQYETGIDLAVNLSTQYLGLRFTGHSLGGGIASAAAIITGGSATTFNAAGVHDNTLRGFSRSNGTIRAYHSTFDVLQIGNALTPASVAGQRINMGTAGFHTMGSFCTAIGC